MTTDRPYASGAAPITLPGRFDSPGTSRLDQQGRRIRVMRRLTTTVAAMARGRATASLMAVGGSGASLDAHVREFSGISGRICASLGIHGRVIGSFPEKPIILVANHVGWIDPLLLTSLAPALPIGKVEVASWPVIGPVGRNHGAIFVDRGDPGSGMLALRKAARLLQGGVSVLNFPEGTTTRGNEVVQFHRGIFGLAARLGVPVLPVSLRAESAELTWVGDEEFLPNLLAVAGRRTSRFELRVGPELTAERYRNARAMADEAREIITHLCRLS